MNQLRGGRCQAIVLAVSLIAVCGTKHPAVAAEAGAADAPAEKLTDNWSQTIPVADPPDAKFGEWRVWVQDGWLLAERRTGDEVIEWKIVLAKVVGDELPKIVVDRVPWNARVVQQGAEGDTVVPANTRPRPGALRLSYRDGRFFIRDELGSLRCLREPKTDDAPWPELQLPPRDAKAKFGAAFSPQLGTVISDSWIVGHAGPRRAIKNIVADCLFRLAHQDLDVPGGIQVTFRRGVRRLTCGKWFAVDDGELLVAERLETHQLQHEIEGNARLARIIAAQEAFRKLPGSPAPVFSGEIWLNVDRPPTWEALRGKPVLLVWFDLKRRSFLPLVGPLLGFQEMYGEQGLAVVGVYANGPRDEIEKRLAEERIKFPVLIDDGKTAERYGAGFSACLLIDREGKVASLYKDTLAPPAEIEKLLDNHDEAD